MKFEAPMHLTYRQLLALYVVSERLFRRKQLLLFRVICLAIGVWRTWTAWNNITANGASFHQISYLLVGLLFFFAGLIPNLISAGFARLRAIYKGKVVFDNHCIQEVIGEQKFRHNYDTIYALVNYWGYDMIFLDPLAALVVKLDEVPGRDAKELRSYLEEKCGKKFSCL